MLQNLTYSYLVAWIVGGLMLLTFLLLRTQRRPFALSFGMIGFGAGGFLSLGFGLGGWERTLGCSLLTGAVGVGLGFLAQILGRGPVTPPVTPSAPSPPTDLHPQV